MPSSYETSSGPNLSEKPDFTAPNNAVAGDSSQTESVDVEDVDYAYVMYAFRMRYPGVHNIADAAALMGGPVAREVAGGLFLLTWVVGVTQVDRPAAAPQEGPYDMEVHSIGAPAFVPGVVATINLFVGYGSTPTFMPVIAEMRSPRSFTKSLFSSQIFLGACYVSFGTVVYM
ncbi:hypothetical protein N0V92_000476 [Colletotrichum tropicale]|nr:hypothetical protein N0V92_000476 [Colletotrichum tropicale]